MAIKSAPAHEMALIIIIASADTRYGCLHGRGETIARKRDGHFNLYLGHVSLFPLRSRFPRHHSRVAASATDMLINCVQRPIGQF